MWTYRISGNEYRITQTDTKISREKIHGEEELIATHRIVGQQVRASMEQIGGVMPEDLPPEPSIKALVSKYRKQVRDGAHAIAN